MNFLYAIYFALPNFAILGLPGKAVNRILGMILKLVYDAFIPGYLQRTAKQAGYGLNTEPREDTYIVSVTSFPARIDDIWVTLETILRQSFKPDKIILWLAKEQFSNRRLPEILTNLMERGLTIEFVDDVRSHTKYFYALQKFPKAQIITLDDDLYYPNTIIEKLVSLHKMNPDAICANRVHKISFSNDKIHPYRKWQHNYKGKDISSPLFLLTGVSGVLYPPNSFDNEVFIGNKNALRIKFSVYGNEILNPKPSNSCTALPPH